MLSLRVFPGSLPTFSGSSALSLTSQTFRKRQDSAEGQVVQTQYPQKMEILLPKACCRVVEVPSPRVLEEVLI